MLRLVAQEILELDIIYSVFVHNGSSEKIGISLRNEKTTELGSIVLPLSCSRYWEEFSVIHLRGDNLQPNVWVVIPIPLKYVHVHFVRAFN